MHHNPNWRARLTVMLTILLIGGCHERPAMPEQGRARLTFEVVATVGSTELREMSGLESDEGPVFLVHNDDGPPLLFLLNADGEIRTRLYLRDARNRDWEDLTLFALAGRRYLVVGDIGDNHGRRSAVDLYVVDWPFQPAASAQDPMEIEIRNRVSLVYPDGPRDAEAMAFDASSGQILLMSKRDRPPRLYGIDAQIALREKRSALKFLGEAPGFRPPTRSDMNRLGRDGASVSQPTGMDINDDGTLAAVITYRSLYLFARTADQSWADAFGNTPREFLGPASRHEEAVAFAPAGDAVMITSEGYPAPIYQTSLPPPRD